MGCWRLALAHDPEDETAQRREAQPRPVGLGEAGQRLDKPLREGQQVGNEPSSALADDQVGELRSVHPERRQSEPEAEHEQSEREQDHSSEGKTVKGPRREPRCPLPPLVLATALIPRPVPFHADPPRRTLGPVYSNTLHAHSAGVLPGGWYTS